MLSLISLLSLAPLKKEKAPVANNSCLLTAADNLAFLKGFNISSPRPRSEHSFPLSTKTNYHLMFCEVPRGVQISIYDKERKLIHSGDVSDYTDGLNFQVSTPGIHYITFQKNGRRSLSGQVFLFFHIRDSGAN